MTWRDSLAPLRERNFRFYFASRFVNTMGNAMASVALAFAVLEVTDDDPAALGLVLAAHTVPMVVLLLWGGVLADRFPRTLVLQVSNLTSAASQGAIAALVVTGTAELWMLVALSAVHGVVSAAGMPAMAGIMPSLVPRDELQRANALMSLVRSGLVIVGPTLSALLVVGVGAGWALAVDALTWLASAVLLGFVSLPTRERQGPGASTWSELREGWTYFRSTQWLWVVVLGFGVLNAIHAGPWFTLGPLHAKDTIGEEGWGLVLSAEAVGLLVMTLVMLRVPLQRPLLWGMLGVSLLGVPIFLFGAQPLLAGAGRRGVRGRRRHRGLQHGLEPRDAGERARRDALAGVLLRHARLVHRDADRPDRGRSARDRVRLRRGADGQRRGVRRHLPAGPALPRRAQPAPGQHHFRTSAVSTVRLRLVATPISFSTWVLLTVAVP